MGKNFAGMFYIFCRGNHKKFSEDYGWQDFLYEILKYFSVDYGGNGILNFFFQKTKEDFWGDYFLNFSEEYIFRVWIFSEFIWGKDYFNYFFFWVYGIFIYLFILFLDYDYFAVIFFKFSEKYFSRIWIFSEIFRRKDFLKFMELLNNLFWGRWRKRH